ncbi:MAG: DinB family protein [Candidatus Tectimicrobiota bacterium]
MAPEAVALNQFIITLLEGSYRALTQATEGLTEEQLYYQPAPGANSIAWLAWHLSRWRDASSATISNETQIWIQDGWDQRCGIASARTGLGDTPDQVRAFRVARPDLLGYVDAAHQVTVRRVAQLTPAQLLQPIVSHNGETRPAWRALAGVCSDSAQHSGQIAYLRGLLSGYGWRR